MSDFNHTIQAVARQTGLSAHVIRIWEKRYGAVAPERTGTNRRLYSDAQVERLALLRQITQSGQSIGVVARLPVERLRHLAAATPAWPTSAEGKAARPQLADEVSGGAAWATGPTEGAVEETRRAADVAAAEDRRGGLPVAAGPEIFVADAFLARALAAVRALAAEALAQLLTEAEVRLGVQGVLQRVVAPLAQALGEHWRDGTLSAAHEHCASAVLRTWLAQATHGQSIPPEAPVLVVATPAGQYHEIGALLVSALAANVGWRVTYLGASLPAAEIAGAVRQNRARALALSLVYPTDDARLEGELVRLRQLLPAEVRLLVGGQAVPAYRAVLERIGAQQATDLRPLGEWLDRIRLPTPVAEAETEASARAR